MSTVAEFVNARLAKAKPRTIPLREEVKTEQAICSVAPVRDEQIHGLVQQLFFGQASGLSRNVGFTPAEASGQIASLCFDVASVVAEEGSYEVGLIDASCGSTPLQEQIGIQAPADGELTWPVTPRLWLASRQSWWPEFDQRQMTDQNLSNLRELMTAFDFSILYCAPISWQTARIGQSCDGLVLVLTANKTRRLVAAQVRDQLSRTRVPLLGTVLAERRFPVPSGLYRSL